MVRLVRRLDTAWARASDLRDSAMDVIQTITQKTRKNRTTHLRSRNTRQYQTI